MKTIQIIVLGLLCLTGMNFTPAEEQGKQTLESRLQQALAAYRNQAATKPDERLIPVAKKLYEIGSQYYQKEDINLGYLAYNYAKAINFKYPSPESRPLLEQAISIFKKAADIPQKRLMNSLIKLGQTYHKVGKKRKATQFFNEAIELAENSGNKLYVAETKLTVGAIYISHGLLTQKIAKKARRYINSAYSIYNEADHPEKIKATFWLGKVNQIFKKNSTAIKFYESVIEQAADNQADQYYAMTSHAFLVDAYSKIGEEEKATQHCQAIGKHQIWEDDVEPKPLFIMQPSYPESAARSRKEGYVTMDFTIDSKGFAKEAMVVASAGGAGFEKASLKVIEKWRFAPKFENGKSVDANVRYTMEYKMAK